jgi:predicted permease
MDALRQDLRTALRTARRQPGVTAVIVLSLALGTGAFTALACLVYGLLLRPLPFPRPGELLAIESVAPPGRDPMPRVSHDDFQDLRAGSRSFVETALYFDNVGLALTGGRWPERVSATQVSAGLLPLLGVPPLHGRFLLPEEDRWGARPAMVLGYDLWQRRFRGDPAIVGRIIRAGAVPYRVVGVMPQGFAFPRVSEAWVPVEPGIQPTLGRSLRRFFAVGRLRPGTSAEAARREVAALGRRLAALHPEDRGWGMTVNPLRAALIGDPDLRRTTIAVLIAVTLVLLIACANIAALLLARAEERHREAALRSALGAGPARLVRQHLTESLLLALAGGALGLPAGLAGLAVLRAGLPPLPDGIEITAGLPAIAAALGSTLAAGLLCGIVPGLRSARPDPRQVLTTGATASPRTGRVHAALVIAEVAIAVALLVSATLTVRTLIALQRVETGIAGEHLLTVWVQLAGPHYRSDELRAMRLRGLLARVAAEPGIEKVAAANFVPFGVDNSAEARLLAGEATARRLPAGGLPVFVTAVTAEYFSTIGARLEAGRELTPDEGSTASNAAVVNATLAHLLWPEGHAAGRWLDVDIPQMTGRLTVVGVVSDFKMNSPREKPSPRIYISSAYNLYRPAAVHVRSRLPAVAALDAVSRGIHAGDPDLALFAGATESQLRFDALRAERLAGGGLALFGGAALFLALVGTHGVLTLAMVRRRREIAVRLALGAPRGHLFRKLIGRGLLLVLAGLALGLPIALLASRALAGQLYGVTPADPLSFGAVAILFLDVAFVACYLPARRALEVDPAEALREE